MKDLLGIIGFLATVVIGALLINSFVFRSFDVTGPSMQETLHTGERVIVDRTNHLVSLFTRKPYIPSRGQIIVFQNPMYQSGQFDKFIVKRVIAFPGERVVVENGVLTVFNSSQPNGFQPDSDHPGAKPFTSGQVDMIVPSGELFVAGDNREGNFSLDSRNGLGTIRYDLVQGPVKLRIFPFNKIDRF